MDSCPQDKWNDIDSDKLCGNIEKCPFDNMNDADLDLVCGNCGFMCI